MWIKTNELKGAALDWAVATALGWSEDEESWVTGDKVVPRIWDFRPSIDWSQGGPLIDELVHSFNRWNDGTYEANVKTGACTAIGCEGDTVLIAAMRAIVASELGDEVDVPEELL